MNLTTNLTNLTTALAGPHANRHGISVSEGISGFLPFLPLKVRFDPIKRSNLTSFISLYRVVRKSNNPNIHQCLRSYHQSYRSYLPVFKRVSENKGGIEVFWAGLVLGAAAGFVFAGLFAIGEKSERELEVENEILRRGLEYWKQKALSLERWVLSGKKIEK